MFFLWSCGEPCPKTFPCPKTPSVSHWSGSLRTKETYEHMGFTPDPITRRMVPPIAEPPPLDLRSNASGGDFLILEVIPSLDVVFGWEKKIEGFGGNSSKNNPRWIIGEWDVRWGKLVSKKWT